MSETKRAHPYLDWFDVRDRPSGLLLGFCVAFIMTALAIMMFVHNTNARVVEVERIRACATIEQPERRHLCIVGEVED